MNLSILLTLVLGLAAAPPQEDAVKAELKKLEGTWTVEAVEINGNKLPDDQIKAQPMTFVFKGNQVTMRRGGEMLNVATVKLDPAKSPKTIDLAATEGQNQGKTLRAIYELKEDTLQIGHMPGGEEKRPKDFQDKTALALITMKRQK
jgi:uncharacterized protein (TIGR03067 family)